MKRLLRTLFDLSFLSVTVALILGFFSFVHPAFDSFSHFRIHLLVLWFIGAFVEIFLQRGFVRYLLIVLLIAVSGYTWMLVQPYKGEPTHEENGKTIKFMQFNLNFRNQHMPRVKAYLEQEKIEIATFQEVTPAHHDFLETMSGAYPFQKYCKFAGVGDVAILSKYPFVASQGECVEGEGLVWFQVMVGGEPLSIASIHLHWPFPYKHHKQVDRLSASLHRIPSPKLIAGDFNAASWSHVMRRITDYSHTSIVPGLRWTLNFKDIPPLPRLQLPIDHILLSEGLGVKQIQTGAPLGSDHLPVVAEIVYEKR